MNFTFTAIISIDAKSPLDAMNKIMANEHKMAFGIDEIKTISTPYHKMEVSQ